MKRLLRKCKGIFLMIFLLTLCFTATVFASETEEKDAEVLTDEKYDIVFTDPTAVHTYCGKEIKPEIEVTYVEGLDTYKLEKDNYEVSYINNENAGTASVVVTGKNGYEGEIKETFTIGTASIENAEVALSYRKYPYTGKEKRPIVTVTLEGETLSSDNYKVAYFDNVEVGTAYLEVTGTGNYAGKIKETYRIVLKVPTFSLGTSYNKVRVWWSEVEGASGYVLYRSTSKDSGFQKVKVLTAKSKEPYIDLEKTFNETYYYKMRAYRVVDGEYIYSQYTTVKSIKIRPATPTIKEIWRVSSSSMKVEWNEIAGATGYKVYRSTSKDGDFTRIATVVGQKNLTYVDTDRTCGRRYYYKVRAYRTIGGEKYHGNYSGVKSRYTAPEKVKISSDTAYTSSKITLEWKKASGASGYEIYRAVGEKGTYKKVKTVSSKNTLEWTNTDLSSEKDYYYKIRAYCEIDGRTVYGSYSNAICKRKPGWRYENGYKLYYNSNGKLVKDVSGILGDRESYVIKVNKRRCTVTVYAKDGENGYIIPVKAFICSPGGDNTPDGTFYTKAKYRWKELMGPCYGQWSTRIIGGILFHSVYYSTNYNNKTLSVSAYNKLGTNCSHGCIRLTAGDAKWIHDNCELKTKVIIYKSSDAGPFGKPSAYKLPYWHTWDPTDPNVKSRCRSRGCH